MNRNALSRLALAGLITGVVDGLFSSILSVAFYGSTVTRLFQGVASTILGKSGSPDRCFSFSTAGLKMRVAMMYPLRALVLLAGLGILVPASSLGRTSGVAQQWAQTLRETSALLQEQKFAVARPRLERLKKDLLSRMGSGETADRLFAIVLGQLAVAQAGSGKTDDAIWSWQVAQNLHPAVRNVDLSGYGPAGQLLREHLFDPPSGGCAKRPLGALTPVITKRVEPAYPEGARQFRESGITIIQIRIDAEGRPSEPRVLKSLGAPITYAVSN